MGILKIEYNNKMWIKTKSMDINKHLREHIAGKYPLTRQHPKTLKRVENTITIRDLLQELEQFDLGGVVLPVSLAEHIHEYLILLRQAVYATGDVQKKAIERLDGYATPMVEFEKHLDDEA